MQTLRQPTMQASLQAPIAGIAITYYANFAAAYHAGIATASHAGIAMAYHAKFRTAYHAGIVKPPMQASP
eukprot:365666-Chlamydomonas_euryale.AAC.5